MTTQCCQSWESRVCLCQKPLCLYIFFELLNLFRPFWEIFRERHDNTVIHASHMGNYMLHAQGSETLQTYTFRLLRGKQRTSVTFQTDGNIPIALHVLPAHCRTRHLIHSQCNLLLARVCFCVSCESFRTSYGAYFTPIHFHNLFRPRFLLYDTQHCYPLSPLVIPGNAG